MHKRKSMVIICQMYPPDSAINAVRPSRIAKYIGCEYNYDVVIYRDTPENSCNTGELSNETIICIPSLNTSIEQKTLRLLSLFLLAIDRSIAIVFRLLFKKGFALKSLREIRSIVGEYSSQKLSMAKAQWIADDVKKSNKKFDVIFTTYGPYYCTLAGEFVKKQQPTAFWISDYRDPVCDIRKSRHYRSYCREFINIHCRMADAITTVSSGCKEQLFIKMPSIPVYVLPNGFDREDLSNVTRQKETSKMLIFTYCGTLYGERQDMTPLFSAISSLIDSGEIKRESILLRYAGKEGSLFTSYAAKFGLDACVQDVGYVTRERSMELQLSSDLLILASWNDVDSQGIVTGKIYEYMMMDKPIVTLVSGNLPNGVTKKMVNDMRLGYCYENAARQNDTQGLTNYIVTQYKRKMAGQSLDFDPDRTLIEQFDYRNIAQTLIDIVEGRKPREFCV